MKTIGVLTSGGDAPGMNAAIRAVTRTCAHHDVACAGIERGYTGLIDGEIMTLRPRNVSGIIGRGGTILRSARSKEFYQEAGRAKAARTCKDRAIDGLILIGGDGTYRGAEKLYEEHGIPCIGMPGTIDNDIGGTDYTIGFATALDTAMDAIDRICDTAHSHERLFYVEVMGRHSGYIAMLSGIAGGAEEIVVPEEPTHFEELIARLRAGFERGRRSHIVVVAEGDDAGNAITVAKEVAARSEFKDFRVAVIGHLQRGGSPTAFDRVLASRLGVFAVESLLEGHTGKMAGIRNNQPVLAPFSAAYEDAAPFDPELLRVSRVLAT